MNLDEFITVTLHQILEGVQQSQRGDLGKHINPWFRAGGDGSPKGKYFTADNSTIVQMVSFDVAVTVDQGLSAGAKGKVTVAGMHGAEGEHASSNSESRLTRIRFEVPLSLPRTKDEA